MSNNTIKSSGIIQLPDNIIALRELVASDPYAFVKINNQIIFAEDCLRIIKDYVEICFAKNPMMPENCHFLLSQIPMPLRQIAKNEAIKLLPSLKVKPYKPRTSSLFWIITKLFNPKVKINKDFKRYEIKMDEDIKEIVFEDDEKSLVRIKNYIYPQPIVTG